MWDGRAGTPEEQVLGSIKSPGEMNPSLDGVTRILSEIGQVPASVLGRLPGPDDHGDRTFRCMG